MVHERSLVESVASSAKETPHMQWALRGPRYHVIVSLMGWLSLSLCILQGSPGLVLCFGANGHVAVETPHNPFQHPASQGTGLCLDLPLVSISSAEHPLEAPLAQASQLQGPVLTSCSLPVASSMDGLLGGAVRHAMLAVPPPGVSLQTAILRI